MHFNVARFALALIRVGIYYVDLIILAMAARQPMLVIANEMKMKTLTRELLASCWQPCAKQVMKMEILSKVEQEKSKFSTETGITQSLQF